MNWGGSVWFGGSVFWDMSVNVGLEYMLGGRVLWFGLSIRAVVCVGVEVSVEKLVCLGRSVF